MLWQSGKPFRCPASIVELNAIKGANTTRNVRTLQAIRRESCPRRRPANREFSGQQHLIGRYGFNEIRIAIPDSQLET